MIERCQRWTRLGLRRIHSVKYDSFIKRVVERARARARARERETGERERERARARERGRAHLGREGEVDFEADVRDVRGLGVEPRHLLRARQLKFAHSSSNSRTPVQIRARQFKFAHASSNSCTPVQTQRGTRHATPRGRTAAPGKAIWLCYLSCSGFVCYVSCCVMCHVQGVMWHVQGTRHTTPRGRTAAPGKGICLVSMCYVGLKFLGSGFRVSGLGFRGRGCGFGV